MQIWVFYYAEKYPSWHSKIFFPVFHRHLTGIINIFLCVIYPEKEFNRLSTHGFSSSLYFHQPSNIKIKTHILESLGLDDLQDLFQSIWVCNSIFLVVRSQHFLPKMLLLWIFKSLQRGVPSLWPCTGCTAGLSPEFAFPALQVRPSLQLSWLQCSSDKISAGQGCQNRIKAAFPPFPVGLMEAQAPQPVPAQHP